MKGNGRAGDGVTVGDGDATRHGGAAVDAPHVVAMRRGMVVLWGAVGRWDGGAAGGRAVRRMGHALSVFQTCP